MKNLLVILFLFATACSENPESNTVKQKQLVSLHTSIEKMRAYEKMNFGKPAVSKNALLMAEVPFDSALIPQEMLQDYFRFVRHNNLIVLQLHADTNFAIGNPEMTDMNFSPASVTKNVNLDIVPDSLKKFIGKKFHMIGENGEAFDAQIIKLKILVQFFPNYGEAEMENETYHSDTSKIAENIWQEGNTGDAMLVGEIDNIPGEGMMIDGAVPAEISVPVLFEPMKGPLIPAQLQKDITTTEQFKIIQKNYVKTYSSSFPRFSDSPDTAGKWTDGDDEQFFSCVTSDSKKYSVLTQSAGSFCGDEFYADLTSVWETNEGKKNQLLFLFPGFSSVTMIFDIEGDGVPEILMEDFNNSALLFKKIDGRWKAVSFFSIPDWRCPC